MTMEIETISAEKLITQIVDNELKSFGQFVCDIYEGNNTSGDESYFVEICFNDVAQRVPAKVTVDLRSMLRTALVKVGNDRFPYLSYRLDAQFT